MIASITAAIAFAISHFSPGVTNIEEEAAGLEYNVEQNRELWETWCNYYQASCQQGSIFVESVFKRTFFATTEQSEDETYEEIFHRQIVSFGVNALRMADREHDLGMSADQARARVNEFRQATQEDAHQYAKIIQVLYLEYYNGNLEAIDLLRAEARLGIAITEEHMGILLNRPMA